MRSEPRLPRGCERIYGRTNDRQARGPSVISSDIADQLYHSKNKGVI